ncbi:unnamed protein product [marine sediment metagenome]|uniref:Uncharacterized protein n=1 Tax=marine sediment metagenome TaxID=412755 RepID=X1LEP8_9ZZZZ
MQEQTKKTVYKLRLRDFIPQIGLVKYNRRCVKEGMAESRFVPRMSLLVLYNCVAVVGAVVGGTYGLAKLLEYSKLLEPYF